MYGADTIAAISTPPGEGGIGVVRLSGPEARTIAERLLADGVALKSHALHYGHLHDADGTLIDEVMVAYMQAPRSYTREDVVEISGHGGAANMQRILQVVLGAGARSAEAGEFTLRAFVNGRLDLAQAEAVLDIITAQTRPTLDAALGQLGGRLSDEVRAARALLLAALAHIEASLDFPEDDVPAPNVLPQLANAAAIVARLLDSARAGIIYRQGLRCAIVGRPNVGKSSLLNALLGVERAIVTPIAGTTRDTVEETATVGGIPIVLVDTAGLNAEASDPVEIIGISRSRGAMATADLVLLVFDNSEPLTEADYDVITIVRDELGGGGVKERLIVALNKSDLPTPWSEEDIEALAGMLPDTPLKYTSAVNSITSELEKELVKAALGGVKPITANTSLVTSVRHRDALARAADSIEAAQAAAGSVPPDLLAVDIRAALNALGEITGETVGEDLLDQIFSKFCIGK